jgi:GNAT superfamily N-acetyltransferase
MDVELRPGVPEDAEACGTICYEAFGAIAGHHAFPSDFPTPDVAVGLMSMLLSHPGFYSVVAERGGVIVGSNHLDERSAIAGVGPITVDPGVQNQGIGRVLMHDVIQRATDRGAPGIRLLQATYHSRSLCLYAELGFQVRDLLVCVQGTPPRGDIAGHAVRRATPADVEACAAVCRHIHGHDRTGELRDAVAQGTALVVEHDGRISGYATDLAFFAHAAGENNDALKALILAADAFAGPGILIPATNAELFKWCLERELRVVHSMTLMTSGLYSPPQGAYLPSVIY